MSDGPHRSLKMRRGWKKLAEWGANKAFAPDEIRDALPQALEQDWRAEVSESFCSKLKDVVADGQNSLFGDQKVEKLEALRAEIAGLNLANTLLDLTIKAVAGGNTGEEVVARAAADALLDRAARGARHVEEHFLRESTAKSAAHVRSRIEEGIAASNMMGIAKWCLGSEKKIQPPAKRSGLDDGVQL